jgi:hypothetical protein
VVGVLASVIDTWGWAEAGGLLFYMLGLRGGSEAAGRGLNVAAYSVVPSVAGGGGYWLGGTVWLDCCALSAFQSSRYWLHRVNSPGLVAQLVWVIYRVASSGAQSLSAARCQPLLLGAASAMRVQEGMHPRCLVGGQSVCWEQDQWVLARVRGLIEMWEGGQCGRWAGAHVLAWVFPVECRRRG